MTFIISKAWMLVLVLVYLMMHAISGHASESIHITAAKRFAIDTYGYQLPPYSIDASSLQGQWQGVALPDAIHLIRLDSEASPLMQDEPTVVVWYRITLPTLADPTAQYLYMPRWQSDGEMAIYCNGRLLYTSHENKIWNGWNTPLLIDLVNTADAKPPHEIMIRIQKPRYEGGGISSLWIGERSSIDWRYNVRKLVQVQLPFISSAAFLSVGIFALFVWFKNRDNLLYLMFFMISTFLFIRTLHFYTGGELLPISNAWFSWITVNSLFWVSMSVYFFVNYLHRRPLIWLNRIVVAVTISVGIITLPFLAKYMPSLYALSSLVYVLLLAMGLTTAPLGLWNSRLAKSREGWLVSVWSLVSLGLGIYDWLLKIDFVSIEGIYLGPYSNMLVFMVFVYIMHYRYWAAIKEASTFQANLERQLWHQELELAKANQQLIEIERKQTLTEERQRLMQDMHDGLGSSLISALSVVELGNISEIEVAQVLKSCIDDLKLTIDSMEPVEADLLLLLATLRYRLAPRLEATGISLRWHVRTLPRLDWLNPKNALHILRILQECFTNIIKHTRATEVRLTTQVEGDFIAVTIADNGQGFNLEDAIKKGGKGLSNQRRRAEAIGASIHWESNNAGSQMILRLPIILIISNS